MDAMVPASMLLGAWAYGEGPAPRPPRPAERERGNAHRSPLLLGDSGLVEVQAVAQEALATPGDVHPTGFEILIQNGQARPQVLQPLPLHGQLR
ncbi:MAG: hypothetical protein ACYCYK_10525, partial [Candidatus Dormibacteria bacterium]